MSYQRHNFYRTSFFLSLILGVLYSTIVLSIELQVPRANYAFEYERETKIKRGVDSWNMNINEKYHMWACEERRAKYDKEIR